MTNLEQARILVKAFRPLLHQTTLWVRSGDKEAATDLLKQMITRDILLKGLGYALSGNENLVVYRTPTGIEKRKIYLAEKAATGDSKAAEELLKLMSKSLIFPEG